MDIKRGRQEETERSSKKDNLSESLTSLNNCLHAYQDAFKEARNNYFLNLISVNDLEPRYMLLSIKELRSIILLHIFVSYR